MVQAMNITPDLVTITKPYYRKLTTQEAQDAARIVWSLVRDDLNPNQFTALVSFVLTTRKGSLAGSVLLKHVNERHIFAAANEFTRWTRKNGKHSKWLLSLRNKQKKLFLTPVIVASNEVGHG